MADKQVGARIRKLREAKGYSRRVFADMTGISSKFLYEIETGRKSFSAETLCSIALALSVSCDYVMLGEDKGHRSASMFLQTLQELSPEKLSRLQGLLERLEDMCDET